MYIPIGPSKKDLYKIIIGLLLIIYLIFLGMYKPKAETWGRTQSMTFSGNNCFQLEIQKGTKAVGVPFSDSFNTGDNNIVIIPASLSMFQYLEGQARPGNVNDYLYAFYEQKLVSLQIYLQNYLCTIESNGFKCIVPTNTDISGSLSLFFIGNSNYAYNYYIQGCIDGNWQLYKDSSSSANQIANNTNDINNNLNDSSIDSSSANDLTSNTAFQDSNGLDAIIKAPLNFIQSLTSSTCSAINLTIPYIDADISLPCMSTIYNKALGQQLVNLIALVVNGVILYRYCLKILQLVHNAKNPNKDELEVLDL